MPVQVYQPTTQNPKKQEFAQILPVAGTVVGSLVGGPAGAAGGGLVGQQLAASEQTAPGPAPVGSPTSAVDRRQMELKNAQALAEAQAVVNKDPNLQKTLGPTLIQAQQMNALQRRQQQGGM